jgi:AraC-like DNA-binding protein
VKTKWPVSGSRKRLPKHKDHIEVLESNVAQTPLGSILRHHFSRNSSGPYDGRRLKHFCLFYTARGTTYYEDQVSGRTSLGPGDMVLVHPEIAHWYGNGYVEGWDEYYIVFEGPAFDLLQQRGVLDPRRPVVHLEPISYWQQRLHACTRPVEPVGMGANLRRICELLSLLAEIVEIQSGIASDNRPPWLTRACGQLASGFGESYDIESLARSCGLSSVAFQQAFGRAMGISPGRYRMAKIIDRACTLGSDSHRLQKEVAAQLGFATEQHFARRFKQVTGLTFGQFRRQWKEHKKAD